MQDPWYGYRTNDNRVLLGERGENLALDPKSQSCGVHDDHPKE